MIHGAVVGLQYRLGSCLTAGTNVYGLAVRGAITPPLYRGCSSRREIGRAAKASRARPIIRARGISSDLIPPAASWKTWRPGYAIRSASHSTPTAKCSPTTTMPNSTFVHPGIGRPEANVDLSRTVTKGLEARLCHANGGRYQARRNPAGLSRRGTPADFVIVHSLTSSSDADGCSNRRNPRKIAEMLTAAIDPTDASSQRSRSAGVSVACRSLRNSALTLALRSLIVASRGVDRNSPGIDATWRPHWRSNGPSASANADSVGTAHGFI